MPNEKPVLWMKSTKKDIGKLPEDVQDEIGYVLHLVQHGEGDSRIKPLKGKDLGGVYEIRTDYSGNTYRAVCALNLGKEFSCCMYSRKSPRRVAKPQSLTWT